MSQLTHHLRYPLPPSVDLLPASIYADAMQNGSLCHRASVLLCGGRLRLVQSPSRESHGCPVTSQPDTELPQPPNIAFVYQALPAKDFGGPVPGVYHHVDMVHALPEEGCDDLINVEALAGKVALLSRG